MQSTVVRSALAAACLLAVGAGSASAATSYPTADGQWQVGKAATGRIDLCRAPAGATAGTPAVPWVRGRTWVRAYRPIVDGAQRRADAAFSLTAAAGVRSIAGNGLPVGTRLGTFPVARGDDAAPFAGGASAPAPQIVRGTIPVAPVARSKPGCMGLNTDLDRCHGHVGTVVIHGRRATTYHYNLTGEPPYVIGCFRGQASKDWTSEPAPRALSVTTTPALSPAFSPSVHDYVSRCTAGGLPVSVAAPDGVRVSVDGAAARTGRFAATVPVASGRGTTIVVTGGAAAGTYRVRCLPADFPAYTARRTGTPQAAYEVVTPSLGGGGRNYVAIFDREGVPVWWMSTGDIVPIDAKVLPDGNLTWGTQVPYGSATDHGFEERRLNGTLAHTWRTVGENTDPHDIQPLANGNMLLLAYPLRAHVDLTSIFAPADSLVADAQVQEVTPSGSLAWSWNSAGHIATTESGRLPTLTTTEDGTPLYDLVHINAVEPDGNLILISARHVDALYAIDRTTGEVVWKLGGTPTPQSLTIIGDPDGAAEFGGQHDVRVLPDGTITLHDNGTARGRPPRALRFRIDRTAHTATLLESVEDPTPLTSACCGSARRLPGGNWVMSWGQTPVVTELTPAGTPVWRLTFGGGTFSYRAAPVADGGLSATALRAGMDAMHPRAAATR